LDCFIYIGCSGFDQVSRKISCCACGRHWLKAQNRDKIGAAIRRYRAEDTHECVRTGFKHDGLAIAKVDEDFETLRGRNPELIH
jgi:hypothetical protein